MRRFKFIALGVVITLAGLHELAQGFDALQLARFPCKGYGCHGWFGLIAGPLVIVIGVATIWYGCRGEEK